MSDDECTDILVTLGTLISTDSGKCQKCKIQYKLPFLNNCLDTLISIDNTNFHFTLSTSRDADL